MTKHYERFSSIALIASCDQFEFFQHAPVDAHRDESWLLESVVTSSCFDPSLLGNDEDDFVGSDVGQS